jgi:23S rRNA (uracil1939-C5)-methyltransferase
MHQKKCVHQSVTKLGKYVPQRMPIHVESIVLLSKLKSNRLKHINVELEMDELDLTVAERSNL